MRQIESERGLLNRADGSARWSQGERSHDACWELKRKKAQPAELH